MSEQTQSNIILLGFMGTGKTSVGRLLAARLDRRLVDMDDEIEAREGRKISEMFATDGENYFRSVETAVARDLADQSNLVVACGGGVVTRPENIEALSANAALLVCLQARPETVLARVEQESHRPLLEEPDKAERIRSLLASRQGLYDALPHQVQTDALSHEEVAAQILQLLK